MLETARLLIRPHDDADFAPLCALMADGVTMNYFPAPMDMARVEGWLERSNNLWRDRGIGRFAVVEKESGDLVGDGGFFQVDHAGTRVTEFGVLIGRRHQGRGYGTEAGRALVDWYASRHRDTLWLSTPTQLQPSRRLAEKLSFEFVQTYPNPRNRGIPTDLYRRAV